MTNALRIRTRIDSDTLHLPQLRPLIGREVEIIVMEREPGQPNGQVRTVASLDELRSKLPGDPFGEEWDQTLRQWRQQPWRGDEPGGAE